MIDQCIYEVYKRDKKVFIPDFGAIIYSDFKNGVDFNSLLDFDDGKVVNEIQKQQFLSAEGARKALIAYLQDVNRTLEEGKSVFFGGIGYLTKDAAGNVSIEKAKSSYQPKKIVEYQDEDLQPERKYPEPDDNSDQPAVSIQDTSPEPNAFEINDSEFSDETDTQFWGNSEEHDLSDPVEENDFLYEVDESTSQRGKILKIALFVIVPALLISLGGFYYFYYHPAGDQGSGKQNQILAEVRTTANVEQVSETEVDPTVEEANSTPPAHQAEPQSISSTQARESAGQVLTDNKTYSLILGSFKVESNADNYKQKLNARGIEAIKFQGKNNFYFVGYEKIQGKTKAVELLDELKNENPSAWIINKDLLTL